MNWIDAMFNRLPYWPAVIIYTLGYFLISILSIILTIYVAAWAYWFCVEYLSAPHVL